MNLIDLVLVIIILLSTWSGFRRGFISGALDLLLLAAGFIFAFWSYQYIAALFEKYIPYFGVWAFPLAFILAYVFMRLLLGFIVRKMLGHMPANTHHSLVNKLSGIIPGFINGIITATIISALLLSLPMFDGLSAKTRESFIASRLSPYAEWAEEKLSPVFDKAINHTLNKLTVEPGSNKSVKLSYTVTDPSVREDLEARMLDLLNEERAKEGLPVLKFDAEMREVARAHSRDMFARGYFSHYTPEGKTPAERARDRKVKFLVAGENLALAQTLLIAHRGLMNSPGHRANILHKAYGRVGIGILDGGRHGIMVTQNFRN